MKKLENYKLKEIMDYIVSEVASNKKITKTVARKLVINAMSYNIVIEAINNQIDFLMEDD